MTLRPVDLDAPDAVFLVFPLHGNREGEGGDAFEVQMFTDELSALRAANREEGLRAVRIHHGQTLLDAYEEAKRALD